MFVNYTKALAGIVVTVLFLALFCACSQNRGAVKNAEELISAIGSIGLESEPAIIAAENAVAMLTEKQVASLRSIDLLVNARNEYNKLVDAYVAEIENAINSIGVVTLDSQAAIEAARTLYDKANTTIKDKVTNRDILTDSEKAFEDLKEEERIQSITIKNGDTVTSDDWKVKLTRAYTSTTLMSTKSSVYYTATDGRAFLILEFDITCLNSTHPTIDGDGITNLVAEVNGNTYEKWEYQYIAYELWGYLYNTYLEANLPLHIYVYTQIPKENKKDRITINLKIDGQDKIIVVN